MGGRNQQQLTSPNNQKSNGSQINLVEGDYIAAKYDDTWYIAKVLQIDNADDEVEVIFMERKKPTFPMAHKG